VLRHLPTIHDPSILVDAASRDDAAVIRIAPDRALIATVDFFTPIVDDAAAWGGIAAANALSDVYAMGGRPLFCLSVVGWPRETLPFELLGDAMEGAVRVLDGAACPIVGGHSVDDPEPKLGFAVIGEVHPDRMLTNGGAHPGDRLILTKPLGTGILTTALKRDILGEKELEEAVRNMLVLNAEAGHLAVEHQATAATDVTGFGLVGHLSNMLQETGLGVDVAFEQLPLLSGALELAREGVVPGGTRRNLEEAVVEWDPSLTEAERMICADAQTSGGLLIAIPESRAEALVAALEAVGTPVAAVIGCFSAEPGLRVSRSVSW
jgi:selenide,water dikinase